MMRLPTSVQYLAPFTPLIFAINALLITTCVSCRCPLPLSGTLLCHFCLSLFVHTIPILIRNIE